MVSEVDGGVAFETELPSISQAFRAKIEKLEGKRGETSYAKKRKRCSFSAEQVYRLEVEFQRQRYLSPEMRSKLALMLGLSQQQVKIWFQNRRYKSKPKENANSNVANVANEMENVGNLRRPVIVLVRDGCPTIEYFITAFQHSIHRGIDCT